MTRSTTSNRRQNRKALPLRRELRQVSTEPEQLVWSVLRRHRIGELKFRRQHSIGCFIVDFACVEKMVVVEIDGGYHDYVAEADILRQRELEQLGWTVIRYSNEDVVTDLEAVIRDLARRLGVELNG